MGKSWWLRSKESICTVDVAEVLDSIPGSGRSLEKEMAAHSRIHAWKTPWKESLVGYSPRDHKIIRHNLETKATTIPRFNVPPLDGLCRYCNFYELKVHGNSVSNKSTGMKRHFMSLCNILIILTFQPLSLLKYCMCHYNL